MEAAPPSEFVPATQAELARFVSDNAAGSGRTLCPVGGRTSLPHSAGTIPDLFISMLELNRVVDYPARDMTITVEAGLRVDELTSQLATEGQRLPIDIAQSGRATIGGALATNTSGPRRFGHGTFRDYVIGISAVSADGQLFKAGGRVVKNVAGYDICKLLVGSHGTLGIITQVTLKLRPLPEASAWFWLSFSEIPLIEPVLERLLRSATRPVALEVLNSAAARSILPAARCQSIAVSNLLCVGLEGTGREVDWQLETLRQELSDCHSTASGNIRDAESVRFSDALTEFPTCADDPLTFQANLLPSRCNDFIQRATQLGVAIQAHAGNGIVIGQLPDEVAGVQQASTILGELRQLARATRGNLKILHCDSQWSSMLPICGDQEPAWPLMRRLKHQLDPRGLLCPGSMIDAITRGAAP